MKQSHALRAVVAIALSLVVLAGACQPDPVGSGSSPRLDNIDPNLTDPDIPSDTARPQFSIRPSTSPRNRLAVLFNGTGGSPSSLTTLARSLAADGYHVIGLRYESSLGTLDACPPTSVVLDPDCHRRLRSEVVYGQNVPPTPNDPGQNHPMASVTAATSVMNRLLAFVQYLKATFPEAGWGQYQVLDGAAACGRTNTVYGQCDLDWDQIVTMGFSQGAGVALYLGKHRELDRIGLLSGPFDAFGSSPNYVPAGWLGEPFATDNDDIAALLHPEDAHVGRQRAALTALGLTEAEVDVTLVDPPYWNSRRLVTTAEPQCPFPDPLWAHNATVGGGCTQTGLHADAWRYLVGGS